MQTTGKNRNTIDKFYTKPSVIKLFLQDWYKLVRPNDDILLEPSAGNGSFTGELKKYGNVLSLDIEPEHPDIIEQDYLTFQPDPTKKYHVIGNPPFGRQSTLALQFINHSSFAESISFILPKSFKKKSMHDKIPLNFCLIYEMNLPDNSFLLNGKDYDVPCVFQIWLKTDTFVRTIEPRVESAYVRFVKKEDQPQFSIRRVGINAGKIDREITNKNPNTHYFLQFINLPIDTLNKLIFQFKHDNTVGPRSISKGELLAEINRCLS